MLSCIFGSNICGGNLKWQKTLSTLLSATATTTQLVVSPVQRVAAGARRQKRHHTTRWGPPILFRASVAKSEP